MDIVNLSISLAISLLTAYRERVWTWKMEKWIRAKLLHSSVSISGTVHGLLEHDQVAFVEMRSSLVPRPWSYSGVV